MPGIGIIYTNESVDRSKHSVFEKLPNTLPLNESVPELFLAPQADKPMSGKAWGLRIKYDCSIVRSTSQFTVLSEKASSIFTKDCRCYGPSGSDCVCLDTPSGGEITLWNATRSIATNVGAYYEVGKIGLGIGGRYQRDYPDFEIDEGDVSIVFE